MAGIGLDIARRTLLANGRAFGEVGSYEYLMGTIRLAVDPTHPSNSGVVDLELAPQEEDGRVHFCTEFALMQPVDPQRRGGRLVFDVVNRGRKTLLTSLNKVGCGRIFTDTQSGAATERSGPTEALSHLREGDTLVVWRLDWLGRSLKHLIETIRSLEERGIGFESLTEHIDTTTPGGKLVFHLFGALAELERDLIRERTQAGLAAARVRGQVGGSAKSAGPRYAEEGRAGPAAVQPHRSGTVQEPLAGQVRCQSSQRFDSRSRYQL